MASFVHLRGVPPRPGAGWGVSKTFGCRGVVQPANCLCFVLFCFVLSPLSHTPFFSLIPPQFSPHILSETGTPRKTSGVELFPSFALPPHSMQAFISMSVWGGVEIDCLLRQAPQVLKTQNQHDGPPLPCVCRFVPPFFRLTSP